MRNETSGMYIDMDHRRVRRWPRANSKFPAQAAPVQRQVEHDNIRF
jgi:hypothetical protein